jgi:hypothetical protein
MTTKEMVAALRQAARALAPVEDGRYEAELACAGLHRGQRGKRRLKLTFRLGCSEDTVIAWYPTTIGDGVTCTRGMLSILGVAEATILAHAWGEAVGQLMDEPRRCGIKVQTMDGFQNVWVMEVLA